MAVGRTTSMTTKPALVVDSSTRENCLGGFGWFGGATHSRGGHTLLARTTQSAETKKKAGQRREIVLLV